MHSGSSTQLCLPSQVLEVIVSEGIPNLARWLAEGNFFVERVENELKERNSPIVARKWRQSLCKWIHKSEVKFTKFCIIIQGTFCIMPAGNKLIGLVGLIDMSEDVSEALDFMIKCALELKRRKINIEDINIEDYFPTGGVESIHIPDPDLCHHIQCDREELSSSPMKTWDTRMWESMGVTCEEWITRGWDIFFGNWG